METTNWISDPAKRLFKGLPFTEGDHSPVFFLTPLQRFWGPRVVWQNADYRKHGDFWWRRPLGLNGAWLRVPSVHLIPGVDVRLSGQECEAHVRPISYA